MDDVFDIYQVLGQGRVIHLPQLIISIVLIASLLLVRG